MRMISTVKKLLSNSIKVTSNLITFEDISIKVMSNVTTYAKILQHKLFVYFTKHTNFIDGPKVFGLKNGLECRYFYVL